MSEKHALLFEFYILGFGYPLDVSDLAFLESLFQLPTLMGFALQSFDSFWMIAKEFPLCSPLLCFPAKLFQTSQLRFSGFVPSKKPSLSYCHPSV